MDIPIAEISWTPSFRIIAHRFPPVNFFESVADPADWEALLELESMTDPSVISSVGNILAVPVRERIAGPGAGRIMPSFTFLDHTAPGSRFSTSQFGAYYASNSLDTAIAETVHHREKFLQDNNIATAQELDQIVIFADIAEMFHDIRNLRIELAEVYSSTDYAVSQALATRLKEAKSNGVVYQSVRHKSGECIAVFRPSLIAKVREEKHITYIWDGTRITGHFEKKGFQKVADSEN